MAFDACMMRAQLTELVRDMPEAKVERVLQPQNDEIDLVLHSGRLTKRLVFNVGPNAPRLQLSDAAKENPASPPMLCMLLRKHLTGARVVGVSQLGFDRIAKITFSCYDEMGFQTEKSLVCEIMGKYANLIFLGADGRIITAMKLIDFSASTVRQILPGLTYELPAIQEKLSPLTIDEAAFMKAFCEFLPERTVEKFITSTYSGIATQIARELAFRATGALDTPICGVDPKTLFGVVESWQRLLINEDYTPTAAIDKSGKPTDYSYMDITYLGDAVDIIHFDSLRELFDMYFAEKDRIERIRQRAHDLISLLNNAVARTERKLAIQREGLIESERAEEHKRKADLITSNIYMIKRGMESFSCIDYYDGSCPTVDVELDPRLSPSQNAARFYKQYNKAKKAKEILTEQISLWERELVYLDSVRAFLDKAECEADLAEIREELYRSGYASRLKSYKPQKQIKIKPLELKTPSGYTLYVGRNNIQNEYLTFKLAAKDDVWFHVKDLPGSHVILVTGGEEPPSEDYTAAAQIAAYYSKSSSPIVAVDYTHVKNIKKVPGAKPGFVTYKTNYTAFVEPKRRINNG